MGLFGWTAKDYYKTQKKHVLKVVAAAKRRQDKSQKREIERLEKQTQVYKARATLKRAKHAANHPYDKGSYKLSDLRRKAGKSGKMRIF